MQGDRASPQVADPDQAEPRDAPEGSCVHLRQVAQMGEQPGDGEEEACNAGECMHG